MFDLSHGTRWPRSQRQAAAPTAAQTLDTFFADQNIGGLIHFLSRDRNPLHDDLCNELLAQNLYRELQNRGPSNYFWAVTDVIRSNYPQAPDVFNAVVTQAVLYFESDKLPTFLRRAATDLVADAAPDYWEGLGKAILDQKADGAKFLDLCVSAVDSVNATARDALCRAPGLHFTDALKDGVGSRDLTLLQSLALYPALMSSVAPEQSREILNQTSENETSLDKAVMLANTLQALQNYPTHVHAITTWPHWQVYTFVPAVQYNSQVCEPPAVIRPAANSEIMHGSRRCRSVREYIGELMFDTTPDRSEAVLPVIFESLAKAATGLPFPGDAKLAQLELKTLGAYYEALWREHTEDAADKRIAAALQAVGVRLTALSP